MATLTVPYSFVAGTTIVPSEMNSNFGAVKTFVEALAAGTNIDAGAITTAKLATATVQLLTPTGVINAYGGSTAPTGWLICDGSAVSRATYADLFTLLGTTYGSGDGTTTFNVPNLKGRVIVGRDSTQTEFDVLGETGGAKTHTLTTGELPSHTHAIDHDHASFNVTGGTHQHDVPYGIANMINASDSVAAVPDGSATSYYQTRLSGGNAGSHTHAIDVPAFTGTSGSAGSGTAHNNLQPYLVINYIIKT
jgi:microcystin-dependent protein